MPPPPPSDHAAFHLHLLPQPFYLKQFPVDQPIPPELITALTSSNTFLSITRTNDEVSVVGQADDETEVQAEWRCIRIAGPMDFGIRDACIFRSTLLIAMARYHWSHVQFHNSFEVRWCTNIRCLYLVSIRCPIKETPRLLSLTCMNRNTDYVLVPKEKVTIAVEALEADGWKFVRTFK